MFFFLLQAHYSQLTISSECKMNHETLELLSPRKHAFRQRTHLLSQLSTDIKCHHDSLKNYKKMINATIRTGSDKDTLLKIMNIIVRQMTKEQKSSFKKYPM